MLMAALLGQGNQPDFIPPPGGIGCEYPLVTVRGAGMGGVEGCSPSRSSLSLLNPSASAWVRSTGLSAAVGYSESDLRSRDGKSRFPYLSFVFPLPGAVSLAGGLAARSSFACVDTLSVDGYTGMYSWEGGTGDGYFGAAIRANPHLAFSAGGRFLFGNLQSEVDLNRDSVGQAIPLTWKYRDDLYLRSSWGVQLGSTFSQGPVSIGVSLTTDRSGELELSRDYITGAGSDSARSEIYDIPGEGFAGVTVRPLKGLSLGMSWFRRKSLSLLGSRTEAGDILALGAEADLSRSFSIRSGFSRMDGLWRDGARAYSGGLSYSLPGDRAVLDLSVTHEVWDDSGETTLRLGFWGSERWR
jgi:hypothetical protein